MLRHLSYRTIRAAIDPTMIPAIMNGQWIRLPVTRVIPTDVASVATMIATTPSPPGMEVKSGMQVLFLIGAETWRV